MKKTSYYIICLFLIIFIGLVMIYSSSMIWAEYKTGNKYYYLIRQILFFIIGLALFILSSKISYKFWYKWANKIFIICLVLMILVLIPGIGIVRGGARSWIGIGDFSIQPAEFMKLGFVIFTAKFLTNNEGIMRKNKFFYLYMLIIGIIFGLIILQPDFGSGIILVSGVVMMLFVGGIQIKNIIFGSVFAIIGVAIMILIAPYRLERIQSFLDPWSDPLGSGFQIIQSLYAISPASLFGYGLFNSKQKYSYIPEPHTDSVFAIIAEENGLKSIIIFLGYAIILWRIFKIASEASSLRGRYLCFGIGCYIFAHVFINLGGLLGVIPLTGVPLPFFSYGGSFVLSLLASLAIVQRVNIETKNKKIKVAV